MASEDDLCREFAETARRSVEFASWLVRKTKFSARIHNMRLLYEEQIRARPAVLPERWWRHWWCTFSDTGTQGETDIFFVFEDVTDGHRFALHIENKAGAPLSLDQARNYKSRAIFMANQDRFLNYSDFSTMIICTRDFHLNNQEKTKKFDSVVFHEQIADFVPSFRDGHMSR